MDRYMKLFVVMSMVYFFAGAVLGVLLMTEVDSMAVRFAHIHLNLLGFMAMMIFGVGYFILPRFNARTLRWPRLVAVHFWVANVTLLSMVSFYAISYPVFLISAVLQVISIGLFAANVGASMLGVAEQAPKEAERPQEGPVISREMRVADLLERWPTAAQVLVAEGLEAFSEPDHLERVKKLGITLAMAASRHGLDEERLLERIAAAVGGRPAAREAPSGPQADAVISKDSVIGEVLEAYPQTDRVFRRFYGEGCFSCPGQSFETVAQSALMHNVKEQEILDELNRVARQGGN